MRSHLPYNVGGVSSPIQNPQTALLDFWSIARLLTKALVIAYTPGAVPSRSDQQESKRNRMQRERQQGSKKNGSTKESCARVQVNAGELQLQEGKENASSESTQS